MFSNGFVSLFSWNNLNVSRSLRFEDYYHVILVGFGFGFSGFSGFLITLV